VPAVERAELVRNTSCDMIVGEALRAKEVSHLKAREYLEIRKPKGTSKQKRRLTEGKKKLAFSTVRENFKHVDRSVKPEKRERNPNATG